MVRPKGSISTEVDTPSFCPTLQVFGMSTLGDARDIKLVIKFLRVWQELDYRTDICRFTEKFSFEASTRHKQFRTLYGTWSFVVILKAPNYWILCSARLRQNTHTHTHTLPSSFIKISFPSKLVCTSSSHSCYIICSSRLSSFKDMISILWRLSIMNPYITIFPLSSFTSWL